MTGVWIALDKATVDNGCLWVIPGSHKSGVLWPGRAHSNAEFDHTEEAFGYPFTQDESIPVELEPGSILFFNGYLLHKSNKNVTESGSRRSYVCHYMSAESLLPWTGGVLPYPVEDDQLEAGADSTPVILYNASHPDTVGFLREIRNVLDQYAGRFSVAEVGGPNTLRDIRQYTQGSDRLNTGYDFIFLTMKKLSAKAIRETVRYWDDYETVWRSWTFSNHDVPRVNGCLNLAV